MLVHECAASQLQMWWNVLFCFWTELQCELHSKDSCPNEPRNTSAQPRHPSWRSIGAVEEKECSSAVVQMRACVAKWCKVFAAPPPPSPELGQCRVWHMRSSKVKQVRNQNHSSKEGSTRENGEKSVLASSHLSQRIRDLLCSRFSDSWGIHYLTGSAAGQLQHCCS